MSAVRAAAFADVLAMMGAHATPQELVDYCIAEHDAAVAAPVGADEITQGAIDIVDLSQARRVITQLRSTLYDLAQRAGSGGALGWEVRERRLPNGELADCFVQQPKTGDMPYGLEVLGDDYNGFGGIERKLEHCKMIVAWANGTQPDSAAKLSFEAWWPTMGQTIGEVVARQAFAAGRASDQPDSGRDAALTTEQIDAIANTFNWHNARCCGVHYRFARAIIAATAAQPEPKS